MTEDFPYRVLAYYYIGEIENPEFEIARHHEFFEGRDVRCRIYISNEGINGQTSASVESASEYIEWMKKDPRFAQMPFKIHEAKEHAFPKITVKFRKQLVAFDCEVDLQRRGQHLSPAEWKHMLEERDQNTLLIDVRNNYEWRIGRFENADLPDCETFREFPSYVNDLKKKIDPKTTPVMVYCTGGIRCEYASALLLKEGFEAVYQLEGGVIEYGINQGADHWEGKLFVFDDRLVVPISEEEKPPISNCSHCGVANDFYYNCANVDCNALFLCCLSCLHHHQGCCSELCKQAKRVRPYRADGVTKPFRKMVREPTTCCNPSLLRSGLDEGALDLHPEEKLLPFSEGGDLQETSLSD